MDHGSKPNHDLREVAIADFLYPLSTLAINITKRIHSQRSSSTLSDLISNEGKEERCEDQLLCLLPLLTFQTPKLTMSSEDALTVSAAHQIAPHLFPERTPITPSQIEAGILKCLEIQRRAVTFAKRPFAACLLGPDNETILLMHQSVDQVNHAESSLARLAYCHYSKEYLWRCTLVSTWEPCAMCSGVFCLDSPLPTPFRVRLGLFLTDLNSNDLLGSHRESRLCSE